MDTTKFMHYSILHCSYCKLRENYAEQYALIYTMLSLDVFPNCVFYHYCHNQQYRLCTWPLPVTKVKAFLSSLCWIFWIQFWNLVSSSSLVSPLYLWSINVYHQTTWKKLNSAISILLTCSFTDIEVFLYLTIKCTLSLVEECLIKLASYGSESAVCDD